MEPTPCQAQTHQTLATPLFARGQGVAVLAVLQAIVELPCNPQFLDG